MANMNCPNEDKYPAKDGRCCDKCAAGQYVKAHCDRTKPTECAECGREFYTATKNYLTKCHRCNSCNPSNNQRTVKDCTAQEDAVCECVTGFYCSNDHCEHCRPVTHCPVGVGVKVQATHKNDTICAPCEDGTYSNVTDFHSPCQTHTRCEDLGRELKTPGTPTTDAICGNFKSRVNVIVNGVSGDLSRVYLTFTRCQLGSAPAPNGTCRDANGWICIDAPVTIPDNEFGALDGHIGCISDTDCHWMLPAGLWSGLVLTALVLLFGLICWRAKRKSYKSAGSSVPVTLVEVVPAAPITQLDLPLPFTELNGQCQESCAVEGCKLPLFNPADDNAVTQDSADSMDSSLPITPLKASVSFAESNHINGTAGYSTGSFFRTYSEPQEDEWCGT